MADNKHTNSSIKNTMSEFEYFIQIIPGIIDDMKKTFNAG